MAEEKTRIYEAGEIIFREGTTGNLMYILVEGAVELRKSVEGGEAVLKVVTTPNDFFGEMAIIDGLPRSATAVTSKRTKLLLVDEAVFESMVLGNPRFALTIIKALSARIRASNVRVSELIETIPRERIAQGMAEYAIGNGERIFDGGWKVGIDDMRAWINSHLGIGFEDINEHLARLIKIGTVRLAATSAKTREHVVLTETFMRNNAPADRRG